MMPIKSVRGLSLILINGDQTSVDTLTAELYVKWYTLYLVSNGKAREFMYVELEPYTPKGQNTYVDHVPNPRAIEAYGEATGITIDPVFLEVAWGRWCLEIQEID